MSKKVGLGPLLAVGVIAAGLAAYEIWTLTADAPSPTSSTAPTDTAQASEDGGANATELSVPTATRLLLEAETRNCRFAMVYTENDTLSAWFFGLADQAGMRKVGQDAGDPARNFGDRSGNQTYTRYVFDENGIELRAVVHQQKLYDDRPPGFNSLEACFVVPASIAILDRTPVGDTGKVVEVRFSEVAKFSKVGALRDTAPTDARFGFDNGSRAGEHVAVFRRLDTTGWRVESIR